MDLKIFNACMLLGWVLILAGGVVVHPGWGMAVAGAVLMVACMVSVHFGGLYKPEKKLADGSKASA